MLLVGKATSMAESLENFPSSDKKRFEHQTNEIGTLLGTFLHVTFRIKHWVKITSNKIRLNFFQWILLKFWKFVYKNFFQLFY